MKIEGDTEITRLLARLSAGESGVADALFPLVYDELRAAARGQFQQERKNHTLQATALVHEAYMRLVHQKAGTWQDRAHFLAIAARVMRQVLVDHARRKGAKKRSAPMELLTMERVPAMSQGAPLDVVALDAAMQRLSALDARKALVAELRIFGDMKSEDMAEALGVSRRTVESDWLFARAWLEGELG